MRSLTLSCCVLGVWLSACGEGRPSQAQLEEARARAEAALHAVERGRSALELLGLLPVYTCGEPRSSFLESVVQQVEAEADCVQVRLEARAEAGDAVVLDFAEGCSVRGHRVSGVADFVYRGGEELMELTADLQALSVDGHPLQTTVGASTCGDEARYTALSQGPLPEGAEGTYRVDLALRQREGLPVIGGSRSFLDGTGEVSGTETGTDTLSLQAVEYELGEAFPRSGTLGLVSAGGGRVNVTFRETLWRLGEAEVQVDDHEPVTLPLIR